MATLLKSEEEELHFNDDMSGYYDYTIICSHCKEDVSGQNWEWWSYCPNCGHKLTNIKRLAELLNR